RMMAIPRSRCSFRSRSRICAWVVTSSAVVGSSAISRRGSQERETAIIARSPASRLLLADRMVQENRLDELRANRMHGAERGHGFLKHKTDVSPANRTHL